MENTEDVERPVGRKVMPESGRCPKCESQLSTDLPEGLCPACLFRQAMEGSDAEIDAEQQSKSPSPGFVPPAPADLAPYFPHLQILELLGQGGLAAVYKARQMHLALLVRANLLPPEGA